VIALALALALELASAAAFVRAQDARAEAHAHFERGVQQAAAREYARALESFEAAYRLGPHPATLYNIGLAFIALDRSADAASALRRYLRDATAEPEAKRARAQAQLDRLLPTLGLVQLSIDPAGARVRVDGRPVDRTEQLLLTPGTHRVQVSLPQHAGEERALVVAAGTSQTLALTLARVRKPSAAAAAEGQLRVIVFPYGSVRIDGEPRGSSPLTLSLPAGTHVIEYGREQPDRTAQVTVIAGQLQEIVLRWEDAQARDAGSAPAAP
jgi:tetratricopeptide (TPR) repeat protein